MVTKAKKKIAKKEDKNEPKSYMDAGEQEGLCGTILKRFVMYMTLRWKPEEGIQVATGYATEWAHRFKCGSEHSASDFGGQAILKGLEIMSGVFCSKCGSPATRYEKSNGKCFECKGKIGSE